MVDNGSTDGTAEHLRREWPAVEVVALAANAGFAAGVNRGLERARGEFVALVNNDVELHPDFLRELVDGLSSRPGRRIGRLEDAALRRPDRHRRDRGHAALVRDRAAARPGRARPAASTTGRSGCSAPARARRSTGARRSTRSGCSTRPSSPIWRTSTGASAHSWPASAAPTCRPRSPTTSARRTTRREGKPDAFFYGLPRRNNVWMVLKNYPASALAPLGAGAAREPRRARVRGRPRRHGAGALAGAVGRRPRAPAGAATAPRDPGQPSRRAAGARAAGYARAAALGPGAFEHDRGAAAEDLVVAVGRGAVAHVARHRPEVRTT